MSAEGEVIDGSTLSAQVEDPDLILTSIISRKSERNGRTLESGTPRLYRDLGYGLFLQ